MQRDVAASKKIEIPGVIETIAHGLSIALARPLLLILPMLIDLYYWVGPKILIESLTAPISTWVSESDASGSSDVIEQLDKIGRSDITWMLSLFVPSFLSEIPRSDLYEIQARAVLKPEMWWLDIPLLLLMVLGAGLLAMIFAVPISNAAVPRSRPPRNVVSAVGIAWLRFLALLVLLIGISCLILGPLAIVTAILLLIGLNVTPLLTLTLVLFIMFGFIVLWFAPDAIVVNEVGPVKAIKYSISMIRNYFWQSIGLASASLLITIGLGELWQLMADTPPGLLFGVIANAYFATGLAIASMSFFANRIQILVPGSVQDDTGPS